MNSIDWTICGIYLCVVILLGWWSSRDQHTNEDYLVGDRKMNWFAIGISLFATTFSALSFVGLPREAAYQDYHLYLAILFIPLFAAPIVGWLFVPLYHRLQVISAYEYLERRFNRTLRLFGSFLSCLYTLGWMGSMLYATGVILQAVLNLTDTQLTMTIITLGLFTTIYTSIGGFKAVVWTDVAQAVVLCGGMLAVLVFGLSKIDGGWATVVDIGSQHGKFDMFNMQLDLTSGANVFSAAAFGIFVYLPANAVAQGAVQRYVSMPSVKAARWSLVVNGVMVAVVCLLFFVVGSMLFAFYHQSLPAEAVAGSGFPAVGPDEVIAKQDQLLSHFIEFELAVPGLMGILLAGLFAAVMSSIDSGANSMTSLVVSDWLDGQHPSVMSSRILSGAFGIGAIIASLLVPHLGKHVFDIIIAISGALFGPLLGVFALGILVPRANSGGAAIGLASGAIVLAFVYPSEVSHWWYGAFTCLPTFFVGAIASLLFAAPNTEKLDGLLAFPRTSLEPAYEAAE